MFASEYGWTIDYIHELPPDQKAELMHAIFYRKGFKTVLTGGELEPRQSLADRAKSLFDTAQK